MLILLGVWRVVKKCKCWHFAVFDGFLHLAALYGFLHFVDIERRYTVHGHRISDIGIPCTEKIKRQSLNDKVQTTKPKRPPAGGPTLRQRRSPPPPIGGPHLNRVNFYPPNIQSGQLPVIFAVKLISRVEETHRNL